MSSTVAAETLPALWLVDKPAGPTSHDVVAQVRRRLGKQTKVGHAGTLDPFATGLLVVLSGRATRLAVYLSGLDKRYRATIRTGFTSATGDPEGPIVEAGPPADGAQIAAALEPFRGEQQQRVPALAAVKVDGERLYRRARRGEAVEAPVRRITIHSVELVTDLGDGRAVLDVHCSKGTYIRQLLTDIGERLGCGAYCEELRRTHVGELSVADAITPDDVAPERGREPAGALAHVPRVDVAPAEALDLAHGRPVGGPGLGLTALCLDGRLVAIGEADGVGKIHPRVVVRTAEDLP